MLSAPSRYYEPDFLREYESLNTKSGEWWKQAAAKRYGIAAEPQRTGLGLDIATAPQMTHGVDTLMHVGADGADGMGSIGGLNFRAIAVLGLAYYGYTRHDDAKEAAIWGLGAYISPLITGALAVAVQMGYIKT